MNEEKYQWINSDDENIEVGSYVDTQIDAGNGQYPMVQGTVIEVRDDTTFPYIKSALVELD